MFKKHKKLVVCGALLGVVALMIMMMVFGGSSNASRDSYESIDTAQSSLNDNHKTRPTLRSAIVRVASMRSKSEEAIKDQSFDDGEGSYKGSYAYATLNKVINAEIKQGRPTYALRLLSKDPAADKLSDAEYDRLRASIARSYLIEGRLNRALDIASAATRRSGDEVPTAGWVGGLSAWRLGKYKESQKLFTAAATAKNNSSWMMSAAAYWASRAALRARNFDEADALLEIAAKHPRTFYGLIATRALGRDFDFEWDLPSLSSKQIAKIEQSPPAMEAIRLAKSGRVNNAIEQLSSGGWLSTREKRQHILIYATENKAPALALHLARSTKDKHGRFFDAALYPETPWRPSTGFHVDRALINALIRQESRFNPNATSSAGATGLMQLMPQTASYMENGDDVELDNPNTNLNVGQNYVRHLLENNLVDNDLFAFAIAYNAGPGNLAKWQRDLKTIKDDPLLFIESIPVAETRAFVERVMVNYWIYRIRGDRDVPSLDAIASGHDDKYQTAGQQHETLAALNIQ
jgi:soluble lytic murein transglycosylase